MRDVPLFAVDSEAKVSVCSYCHESVSSQWFAWCATHVYNRWGVDYFMLECVHI